MQNFQFHGRKGKRVYTSFTAPYFAFVRLGRVFCDAVSYTTLYEKITLPK